MEKPDLKSIDTVCKIVSGDVRKRYYDKISIINVDPYSLSAENFGTDAKDRNKWPDVTNFDIIGFFVFKESAYTRDQLRNHKSLEAYKYFQDGWVQEILHTEINGFHLMKAKVNKFYVNKY